MDSVAARLLHWWDEHGRKDLPWQHERTPYRVWISEIMLQQTQVSTVIPYYQRFMTRFPDVETLAAAQLDDVLHHWTGLGYYARARNLHRAAQQVVDKHGGVFPVGVEALTALPGIGRSTAGAIASLAQDTRAPILDGNVKRVLARHHAVAGYPGESAVAAELWTHAENHTPQKRFADYTQAIMDLGATLCRRSNPGCGRCPLQASCEALKADAVSEFPGRKPKKEKPVRQCRMFLLHTADGAVLLEQRPDSGLWGGLWTPPQRPRDISLTQFADELGLSHSVFDRQQSAPVFRHTFTHFHLDIEPVYALVSRPPDQIRDTQGWRWHRPGSNEAFGLAAPAVRLLQTLQDFTLT